MPALRRSGTGVLETKGEEKIYIDKKNGGRISCCFCFYGLKRASVGRHFPKNMALQSEKPSR